MNSPEPSPNSLNRRGLRQFAIILCISGVLCLAVILRSCYINAIGEFSDYDIQKHPEKYPAFNFALVETRPEWYDGASGMVSGTFVGFISAPPNSDSPYTYLQIAQDGLVENKNAVWIVYGVMDDDDKQKLAEGMDVAAYGHCAGLVTVQRIVGDEEHPGLQFENLKFGTYIRP